ncbi:alpha-amylase [Halanaerobacter jeridensis]|uniref:Alpha-amylase n=1 Tax=Halanaerobacter jeridensis TaxID=706427 RepID=A0A939BQ64_9FIRM|nr:alpha-amylase [Halanaerobacter jeridensis]MBM7557753.1 alpha-amylase [Halanaerobacter jeridensis]
MNEVLMQAFYWEMNQGRYAEEYPEEENLWQLLAQRSEELSEVGITSLWLPPANKGKAGSYDVGYGTYDLWDLGEFYQQGTVRTKYGTKEELEEAIKELHQQGIDVYYDAVLNHRLGADESEVVELKSGDLAEVWTKFKFPGRDKYSTFEWDWQCFDGIDWDQRTEKGGKYLFVNKQWDKSYAEDYIMGADIDYQNSDVRAEVKKWGYWIVEEIGFDGFRLDASKHIDNDFIAEFISYLQQKSEKDLQFIGESWEENPNSLIAYLEQVGTQDLSVFDFALRNEFTKLRDGNLDLRWLGGAGLVNQAGYEERAVTFVDSHDTDRDNEDKSISKRKQQAYAYILMREDGLPCIYWKDYYIWGLKEELDKLIDARQKFAYGPGYETNTNDYNTYSYIREGSSEVPNSGLVMMITQSDEGGVITKEINSLQSNTTFYDYTGNIEGTVETDNNGVGEFKVQAQADAGWSIWVPSKK